MKLEQSFTVTAPIEQVWAALVDVEAVAPCLPGAQVTGQAPDGSYEGAFSVKLGPTTAAYRGSLKMDALDEARRTATMHADGTDKRGQGAAHATIVSSLRQHGAQTTVDVATDFTVTGRLARFGRSGMIEDISKRLMRDFASCLQARLEAELQPGRPGPPLAGVAASEDAPAGAAVVAEAHAADEAPTQAEPPPATPAQGTPPRAEPIPAPSAAPRTASQPARPVKGLSLLASVLWERITRFLRRLFGRGRED